MPASREKTNLKEARSVRLQPLRYNVLLHIRFLVDHSRVKASLRVTTLMALCFCFLLLQPLPAQNRLVVDHTVARNLESAAKHLYSIPLNDGDYVSAAIKQQGQVNAVIFNPDGSLMRRSLGPPADGKREFRFSAEGAGTYTIEITSPTDHTVKYELLLTQLLSLSER